MKKKMDLAAEIDLTQDSVVQLTSWCGQIAARLPLSGDEVQRKIEAAKAQMSMGAFRRRV